MTALRPLFVLVLLCGAVFAGPAAHAEPTTPGLVDAGSAHVVADTEELLSEDDILDGKCESGCCINTGQKVVMGMGSLVTFVILFFLMVRLVERAFIRQNKSPLLGRHLGISLALFLGGIGMVAIFYLVGGCWHPSYGLWGGFVGLAWGLHLAYTMFAIKQD